MRSFVAQIVQTLSYQYVLCRIVFLERPVVYSALVKEVMALFPVHPTLTFQDDKVAHMRMEFLSRLTPRRPMQGS